MKKKLEAELMNVAIRVLRLEGKDDLNQLHAETAILFEKLSVLKFLESNPQDSQSTVDNDTSNIDEVDTVLNNQITDSVVDAPDVNDYASDNDLNYREDEEEIIEPVMEKIKDIVAQMPEEGDAIDALFEEIVQKPTYQKNDFEEITADFKETPIFEPVTPSMISSVKKSLNDKLKSGGLNIGLNDKIAFIKQLFDGSQEDYDRVISQINTCTTFEEASNLIQNVVKTDYNNWEGKDVFEERFMQIIEGRFK
ncbi:hypothetical protein [Formosa haliotis]|uniref:hypothetical protein n=1 Tax=Formosa haliotis TaxID=1555194 RepID=UPI000824E54C|nr:hypothetical protein [Formosa haliotis]